MSPSRTNSFGQPIGAPVPDWQPRPAPLREPMTGTYCRLEPADPARHAEKLYAAFAQSGDALWTYLPYGPFATANEFHAWMDPFCRGDDPRFFAILDQRTSDPVGLAAYLRIERKHGVVEVGHLAYSQQLQRTPAATEAMYLMMQHAFDLGYRRYEWKCDALNAPSRAAARRLGFSDEGLFLQAIVTKGRNRDTAWYSIIDREWPAVRAALQRWLAPDNFDAAGRQRVQLSALTAPLLRPQTGID